MQGKKPVRLVLAGGETGGHLYPALAIAEALAETVPGSQSIYIGAAGRVDIKKAIGEKYTTHALCMTPYDRGRPLGNVVLAWKLLNSFRQAWQILGQYRPHAVMGVGAFPSVPVILAAWMKRIPALLLEPNSQPGMANTLLARTARRICVSQTGMERFFPRDKIVATGTPVRAGLLQEGSDPQGSRAVFGIPEGARTVLITGGSTGSATINRMVLKNLDLLAGNMDHMIWQTGKRDEPHIRRDLGNRLPRNCTLLPYIDRMGCAYAAADLVVSSAGAVSLSELSLLGKPALIIPDPDVTENHQLKNAQHLYENKACVLVSEKTPAWRTAAVIVELLNSPSALERLKTNILPCGEPQAARRIVEQILQVAGRGN